MQITCPKCKEDLLIYLGKESIQALKKGISCLDCNHLINFKLVGNKAFVQKNKPQKRIVINKPSYQLPQISQACY